MESENYLIEHYENDVFSSYADTKELKSLSLHIHNYYEMNLFLEGDIVFIINERRIVPKKGMLFLIDNTQIHGPQKLQSNHYKRAIVHFNPKVAKKFSTPDINLLSCFSKIDYKKSDYVILNEADMNKFIHITKKLDELERKPDEYGLKVLQGAYLAELLVLVNAQSRLDWEPEHEAPSYSDNVQDVMQIISEELNNEFSLDVIEKKMNMNRQYMNRIFKKETGLSIYKYFIMKKIAYAKKLILEGYTPKEVSIKLSYQDYSTFLRSFKHVTQMSPREFVEKQL